MYHVDVSNQGDSSFIVRSQDYQFTVDTKGKGITPPDTLLASIGTCLGVYIRKYAESAKLALVGFSLSLDADFSTTAPVCFKEIKVDIDLKGASIDERRKKALLEFIKNCPVHNTLKSSPQLIINFL